jgi:hypothetical protein
VVLCAFVTSYTAGINKRIKIQARPGKNRRQPKGLDYNSSGKAPAYHLQKKSKKIAGGGGAK